MQIPTSVSNTTAGVFAPTAMVFLGATIQEMIPWLLVMYSVIICDLLFGIRKSMKLGIHVSASMAIRETMSKMVTYTAFVLMVCMLDVATESNNLVAKWGCLLICIVEGISIVGNFLKPFGIDFSVSAAIKVFATSVAKHFGFITEEEVNQMVNEEDVETIRKREKTRWEKRKKREQYGTESQE